MKKMITLLVLSFLALTSYSQNTYVIGDTEYYYGQYYSTTGKPMVKRSQTNVQVFLKSLGYQSIPVGYQVDHIIPLSQGGTDSPSNMQLLTIEQHKAKTAQERSSASQSSLYVISIPKSSYKPISLNTITYPQIQEPPIPLPTYSTPRSYNLSPVSTPSSSGRIIQTGPRGGKYYINSNGNKTYVK